MAEQTIWLRGDAPNKPEFGAPCNGCGTCCASQPCPVGMLLSLRTHGRCRMLRFDQAASHYRCGLMPRGSSLTRRPDARWHTGWPARLGQWLVARWIAAGIGCDSTAQANPMRR